MKRELLKRELHHVMEGADGGGGEEGEEGGGGGEEGEEGGGGEEVGAEEGVEEWQLPRYGIHKCVYI